jgi:hypothetical protein
MGISKGMTFEDAIKNHSPEFTGPKNKENENNMVQVPKRCKSSFLKPSDVEKGDIVTILKPPSFQSADESTFKKERTIIDVKLNRTGAEYRWGLNNTTNDALVDGFGSDGEAWVNREVRIDKKIKDVKGKEKEVLYGIPQVQEKKKKPS